jgi:hypothetical protein
VGPWPAWVKPKAIKLIFISSPINRSIHRELKSKIKDWLGQPPQSNMKLTLDHVMLFHKILANESENHLPNVYPVYIYIQFFSSLFLQ